MAESFTMRRRMAATSSWAALGVLLAFGNGAATAQVQSTPEAPVPGAPAAPQAPPETSGIDVNDQIQEILVVGSRASQQTANSRKRNARTPTDSIVADDIGSFPDRNVNEAISRIPGVALNRNGFGEGEGVAVRGNGPDLTRVELDGLGVQGTNALGLGATRSADLREIPAELVKSIDVVKGATADMTEGSLGGTIQIKTRSGLDFKEPYFSVRGGAQQNSLGKAWTPDFNAVASRKFFGDRLGVIVSGTYQDIQNDGHGFENTTSNTRGYSRLFDFDQSPEKTFEYNLDSLGTDLSDVVFANSTETPRTILQKSIDAKTKGQCFDQFPNMATNANGTNTSTAQRNQRIVEQQSCLNQWNDYTPSLIRHFMNTQRDKRTSFDSRVDYRVTDNLTIFAKGTIANRKVRDTNRSRNPVTLFGQNVAGTFVTPGTGYVRTREVAPNSPGYFLYDPQFGLNPVTTGTGNNAVVNPVLGNVLNIVPGSIKVDSAHNLTEFTLTNNSVNIDQIENIIDTKSKYAQAGAEYRGERLELDAFIGITEASTYRGDMRTSRSYSYGDATLSLQPNGLWETQLPANYDERNPANFVQLTAPRAVQNAVAAGPNGPAVPAYTIAQLPLVTPAFSVSYSPRLGKASERQAKIDAGYRTDDLIPFISRIKAGGMYRNNRIDAWGGGGYTAKPFVGTFGQPGYVPAVVVPTANVRGTLRACEPTAGSTGPGGLSCNYGFVPSANPANVRSGVDTLTPEALRDLFARTLQEPGSQYFGDLPNRGNLPMSWQGIKTDQLFSELGGSQFMNFDCLITCVGSDGQVYEQPVTRTRETIKNIYGMIDFEQRLPLGLLFNGNVGVRGIFRDITGSGLLTLNSISTTAAFNPADPNAAAGITTQSFAQNISYEGKSTDWLPSFNANLWAFDEKIALRVYGSKTVALPSPGNLLPAGTCIIDQRQVLAGNGDDPFGCTGRIGNPDLKPFTAWSYNASLEWYPNADTVFSAAFGRLDVKIGNPISVTRTARPFADSDQIDPRTGLPLSDFEFSYPTLDNGPGFKRDIFEFQAKTAFTVLPGFLKYTGVDANLSILSSAVASGTRDPLTAELQAPPDESKYYTNVSVWYDDGKLNLRLAYQRRTSRFTCITPCGGNTTDINYPGENWTNVRLVGPGYNPGVARFVDGSTFIDAKIAYNITQNVQVYVEGRNIRQESQTISTGKYTPFGDGSTKVMQLLYGGRRILMGARVQFGK